jgi:hypothetical protein
VERHGADRHTSRTDEGVVFGCETHMKTLRQSTTAGISDELAAMCGSDVTAAYREWAMLATWNRLEAANGPDDVAAGLIPGNFRSAS